MNDPHGDTGHRRASIRASASGASRCSARSGAAGCACCSSSRPRSSRVGVAYLVVRFAVARRRPRPGAGRAAPDAPAQVRRGSRRAQHDALVVRRHRRDRRAGSSSCRGSQHASVHRDFPGTLRVTVTEYAAGGVRARPATSVVLIAANGHAIARVAQTRRRGAVEMRGVRDARRPTASCSSPPEAAGVVARLAARARRTRSRRSTSRGGGLALDARARRERSGSARSTRSRREGRRPRSRCSHRRGATPFAYIDVSTPQTPVLARVIARSAERVAAAIALLRARAPVQSRREAQVDIIVNLKLSFRVWDLVPARMPVRAGSRAHPRS